MNGSAVRPRRIRSRDGRPVRTPHRAWAAAVLTAAALSVSCSGHAPELAAVEYRLALRPLDPRGTRVSEQLAVFAAARDEDGFKDIAALHILHDQSEYLWTFTPETWTRNDRNKEIWLGGTGLSVPDFGALPRGLYRVVLEDLAGDSDEASFSLGPGLETGASFPAIRRTGDSVSVVSRYARTELLFLDASGVLLRTVDAPRVPELLDRLYGSAAWREESKSLAAYAYDAERNLGIYSWTMELKP